ncbi:hypothetical protein SLEP1_g23313 [Rubroshorea leprosula]|uniref:Uncharacterized protein n=1 Tax=Rubroshorea leprosula TaxID=152421 RepID=A0AAV5JKR8_9ROSI|nr:hypothetical protein SLEP1_g23313 [Rubroshorea leprosula]
MFNIGDELIIEDSRIPWLIWIQILVLFLLLLLLYCFSIFPSDLSDATIFSASSSISHHTHLNKPLPKQNGSTPTTDCLLQAAQAGENHSIKGEIATDTRRRVVRGEDIVERESTSSKDTNPISFHPCDYFRLAKLAFLKCLGLDPSTSEQRNGT